MSTRRPRRRATPNGGWSTPLPEPGARVDVDVRVDAALADEPEVGKPSEQLVADLGPLADQHDGIRVGQPLGQNVGVLDVVRPNGHVVAIELGKGVEGADGVEVVVEDRHLHGPWCSTPRAIKPAPRAPRSSARARGPWLWSV